MQPFTCLPGKHCLPPPAEVRSCPSVRAKYEQALLQLGSSLPVRLGRMHLQLHLSMGLWDECWVSSGLIIRQCDLPEKGAHSSFPEQKANWHGHEQGSFCFFCHLVDPCQRAGAHVLCRSLQVVGVAWQHSSCHSSTLPSCSGFGHMMRAPVIQGNCPERSRVLGTQPSLHSTLQSRPQQMQAVAVRLPS